MQIKIGSILYVGGDSAFHLAPPVQGLESPAIRVGDGLYAGRDGGFVSGHFYGHRTIVINGFYIGLDCEEASELRETLFGLLRIRYLHPIVITTATHNWYTEGVVTAVKSDIENEVSGKYQITLLCPDPILYRLNAGSTDPTTIRTSKTMSIQSGTGTLTIDSASSVDTYPIITWNGRITGFSATNETTGKVFALDDSVPSGQTVIDFGKRTVIVNDVCYNSHRLVNSEWWTLIPGENIITFANTNGNNNSGSFRYVKEARGGI